MRNVLSIQCHSHNTGGETRCLKVPGGDSGDSGSSRTISISGLAGGWERKGSAEALPLFAQLYGLGLCMWPWASSLSNLAFSSVKWEGNRIFSMTLMLGWNEAERLPAPHLLVGCSHNSPTGVSAIIVERFPQNGPLMSSSSPCFTLRIPWKGERANSEAFWSWF